MLIVGSFALAAGLSELGRPYRDIKDIDLFCSDREIAAMITDSKNWVVRKATDIKYLLEWGGGNVEIEKVDKSPSAAAYHDYCVKSPDTRLIYLAGFTALIAPLEVLYSIKLSHRHYPRNFKKHAEDLAVMREILGTDRLPELTAMRTKEKEERDGKLKTPSLDKTADAFFNDNVSNRLFIHDDIHAVMAHRDKPMFEYIKKDSNKVACSKAKFLELAWEDRVRCVLEEAYVIALERCILPMLFDGKKYVSADDAFDYAIMRISTTLCSGWFREFAIENYSSIMLLRDRQYVEKFLTAVQDGKISQVKETV